MEPLTLEQQGYWHITNQYNDEVFDWNYECTDLSEVDTYINHEVDSDD